MELDLIMPITKRDKDLVLKNKNYYFKNLPISHIVFIASSDLKHIADEDERFRFIDEDKMYPNLSLLKIKTFLEGKTGNGRRAGWYFQQFIKMYYSKVCPNNYYLVWDSDTIPLTKIDLFSELRYPFLSYREYVKYDKAYTRTINILAAKGINIEQKNKYSFVTEHMLFKTAVMAEFIDIVESKFNSNFYEAILNSINVNDINLSGFSEFETYAAYILTNYPNMYEMRYWNNLRNGKVFVKTSTNHEIINWIGKDFCSMSLERFDKHFILFSDSVLLWMSKRFSFCKLFSIINPVYKFIYNIRMILRQLLKA